MIVFHFVFTDGAFVHPFSRLNPVDHQITLCECTAGKLSDLPVVVEYAFTPAAVSCAGLNCA